MNKVRELQKVAKEIENCPVCKLGKSGKAVPGSVACFGLLDEKITTIKMHGKVILRDGLIYLITVHPAAAMRFPILRRYFENDFNKLKILIDKNFSKVQN